MDVTRGKAVFLKSIDCTEHMAEGGRNDAAYIAAQTLSVIEEIGPQNVVQVIMDRNKLNPATTEKLVYVSANCKNFKIEPETLVDGDLKMFAWDDKESDV